MKYLFECGACRKTTEIDIKLENYDSEKERQRCSCGGKMKRVIEMMEIDGNEDFLNWLSKTLSFRPPKNYYIDSERGVEVCRLILDFERDNFSWRRSDEDTFWIDVQMFVKYKLSDDEILFICKNQGGIENNKKYSEERKAYGELMRGLKKLREINQKNTSTFVCSR